MKYSVLISSVMSFLTICSVAPIEVASENVHRFGTYNIRYMNKDDNNANNYKSWCNRYQKVPELILKYDFDVIGMQEVTSYNNGDAQRVNPATGKSQLEDIRNALNGYSIVGWEREGKDYQYNLIAYKTAKYELIDRGRIVLSQSGKLGGEGWDSALYPIKRCAGWAKFRDKVTNEMFVYCVAHTNYGAGLDGIYGNRFLSRELSEIAGELPVVLVGDFNMRRKDHEKAYRGVAAYFEDARLVADVNECWPVENGQTDLTAVGWTTMANPSKLKGSEFDYVFTRNIKVSERHILTDYYMYNGEPAIPSDHFPILTCCILGEPRPQRIWCVSSDGSDNGDGSAAAPFRSISKAIESAYIGDEIRIAAGTYNESVIVDKSLSIAGGYNSTFSAVDGRSILDAGKISGTIIAVPKYYNLSLSNLTLRNCVNTSSANDGAVYFCGNTLDMNRVTFEDNTAFQNGGAIWAQCNEINAKECIFSNNDAKVSGGAIYYNNWADARFERCEFVGNSSATGAAVYATSDAADPTHLEFTHARNIFESCTFIDNVATQSGTVCLDGKLPNIRSLVINSTFANNRLNGDTSFGPIVNKIGGSAISANFVDKGTHNCNNSTLEMAHCSVIANHDTFQGRNKQDYGGGAIHTSGGTTHIVNNIFLFNTTEASTGYCDVVAESGVISSNNVFSGPGSTQCAIGVGSLQATASERQSIIVTEQADGKTRAVLAECPGYGHGVELKTPLLGTSDLRCINAQKRDIEKIFGLDLNRDGKLGEILVTDQFGRRRQDMSVPGALEYAELGAILLPTTDSGKTKIMTVGINRYVFNGDVRWSVYALDGRFIKSGDNQIIDLNDCAAGVYIVRADDLTVKLIVK